jgi:hypothetical protein
MTPEAKAKIISDLEQQLFHIERAPVRNYAEACEREHRVACIKRDIQRVEAGLQAVGHP